MPAKFRDIKKVLKKRGITWDKSRGKGSHGVFSGPDGSGDLQSFPIPKSEQREINDIYLSSLARRFDVPLEDLKP